MKRFIKFLKDNNAWENFQRAFKSYGRNVEDYKKECESIEGIELDAAFRWDKTKEGVHYWNDLNDKWLEENQSLKDKSLEERLLSDD